MDLEAIKVSLLNNPNLNDEIREKLFELIQIFNKKLPQINLADLNKNLKNVKIAKSSKFLKNGVYSYDYNQNVILFSSELEGDYDIDNLLMKAILEMSKNGILKDERFKALNVSLTEMLATALVGNDGESDLKEEIIIANLLSYITNKDTLFNSYFSNNYELVSNELQIAEVGLNDSMRIKAFNRPSDEILNSYNRLYQAKLTGVLTPNEFPDLLILCGDLFANKIIQGKVKEDEIADFEAILPTSNEYFQYSHDNIIRAYNTIIEGNDIAFASIKKRYSISSSAYTR